MRGLQILFFILAIIRLILFIWAIICNFKPNETNQDINEMLGFGLHMLHILFYAALSIAAGLL